jgi:uncharacterized protein YndB with AHSA1/START domain
MATVTVSRQIAAPIEEVFKVFTDQKLGSHYRYAAFCSKVT